MTGETALFPPGRKQGVPGDGSEWSWVCWARDLPVIAP